ncbi:MAG: ABC transporter ATP-binding protein [Acidobacteriota bacterium]|jgi:putative ABC transport system ATP-binding protein|nr:ABC transporter ATP-binding protein [Acidobacteriota bacterium]
METPFGNAIETVNLSMTYRSGKVDVPAVDDVNLTVKNGEFIAIMGPSGCGKTTLLHMLGGLLRPTGGKILVDGIDIASLSDAERTAVRRKKIGYVFQRFNLLPTLTARGNIELAKRIHGNGNGSGGGKYPDVSQIFEMLSLSGKEDFRPLEMSGGEQQRVAIARAVINRPSIILADEPTGSLDSRNARTVLEMLRNLNEKLGQSIVMITHDADAASTADRVIEMRDGRMLGPKSQFSFKPELERFY